MMTAADARRRWFGAFFLALAAALLIWGRTVLKAALTGWGFLLYWLACFIFTGLAMIIALLDIRAVRRDLAQRQKDIWENALREFQSKPPPHSRPPGPARTPSQPPAPNPQKKE